MEPSTNEPSDRLTLAETHVDPTLTGAKTLTARYEFEREYHEGLLLFLQTPDDTVFATARVDRVVQMSVEDFVNAQFSGHQTYDSTDELLAELERYYPSATLSAETRLTVIWFTDVEPTAN